MQENENEECVLQDAVVSGRGKGYLCRLRQETVWEMLQGEDVEGVRSKHVGTSRWFASLYLPRLYPRKTR